MKALEERLKGAPVGSLAPTTSDVVSEAESDDALKSPGAGDYELALRLQQEEETLGRKRLRHQPSAMNKKYSDGNIRISKKRQTALNEKDDAAPKRRGRPLNKPMVISSALRSLFNNRYREMTRPECVKLIWEYIKANNLQDPKDRRMINCDDRLFAVFKKQRVSCFGMNKYLSGHLHSKAEIIGADLSSSESESASKSEAEFESESEFESEPTALKDSGSQTNGNAKPNLSSILTDIPGVSNGMTFPAVQAAVLAYTQAKDLRDPLNTDSILLKAGDPVARLMNRAAGEGSVHLLELLERTREVYGGRK
jgi:chromatin remodeling complex protein RSC6